MRRNLSGQINHAASGQVHLIDPNVATRREDNLVRLDAQGRLIDSRGQRVSPSIVINMPPKQQTVEPLVDPLDWMLYPFVQTAKHVVLPAAKLTFPFSLSGGSAAAGYVQ